MTHEFTKDELEKLRQRFAKQVVNDYQAGLGGENASHKAGVAVGEMILFIEISEATKTS